MSGVFERVLAWAGDEPAVRAAILTSTRARTDASVDAFSDYDLVLGVTDVERFAANLDWQAEAGPPLVRWGDEAELLGHRTCFRGVIYEDFTKVDFSLWPVALITGVTVEGRLPAGLDHGYRVLLDKDGATDGWPAPTFSAYVLRRPSAEEYRALVEEFWWDTTYAAKALRRGERFFARTFMLEHDLKLVALGRMLEWRIAIGQDWTFAPGVYGRGLERHLDTDLLAALDATATGPSTQEVWEGLFATVTLFRRVAREVAGALGYEYPEDIDERMVAYLEQIRAGR